jgi:hypothetical protein
VRENRYGGILVRCCNWLRVAQRYQALRSSQTTPASSCALVVALFRALCLSWQHTLYTVGIRPRVCVPFDALPRGAGWSCGPLCCAPGRFLIRRSVSTQFAASHAAVRENRESPNRLNVGLSSLIPLFLIPAAIVVRQAADGRSGWRG